jgi:hypothetical protein
MAVRLRRRNTSRRQHNSRCDYSGDLASHIVLRSKSCRLFEAGVPKSTCFRSPVDMRGMDAFD